MAATSAANAWAVGAFSSGVGDQAFILHWNGATWAHVVSPRSSNSLSGVAASSAANAWAVGTVNVLGVNDAFAIHCC